MYLLFINVSSINSIYSLRLNSRAYYMLEMRVFISKNSKNFLSFTVFFTIINCVIRGLLEYRHYSPNNFSYNLIICM